MTSGNYVWCTIAVRTHAVTVGMYTVSAVFELDFLFTRRETTTAILVTHRVINAALKITRSDFWLPRVNG